MAKPVKKAPAKKAPAKKAAAKPKMAKPVMKTPMHAQPDNFMTRMLKKKEAERMAQKQNEKNSNFEMHPSSNHLPTGSQGFGRFNGPRRKAA